MVWWVIGSIPHVGPSELFFVLARSPQTGVTKALVGTNYYHVYRKVHMKDVVAAGSLSYKLMEFSHMFNVK